MTLSHKIIAVCVYIAIGWLLATLFMIADRKVGRYRMDGIDYAMTLLAWPLLVAFIPPYIVIEILRWASEKIAKALVRRG